MPITSDTDKADDQYRSMQDENDNEIWNGCLAIPLIFILSILLGWMILNGVP